MDISSAKRNLQLTLYIVQVEKLVTGSGLVLIAAILLAYVLFYIRLRSHYMLFIPFYTVIWGLTGILAFFLDQDNSIYHETTVDEKITLMVRLVSINMVHWIFVMKYYSTSMMLPMIFHDIMIDDFIEGGKVVKRSEVSAPDSVQEISLLSDNDFGIFDLSEYGTFGNLRVDRAQLKSIILSHKLKIKAVNRRLNWFYYATITLYALSQVFIWYFPVLSEVAFASVMTTSWIFFMFAMVRIKKALKKLPNCFTNECITSLHFTVLSIQGVFATLYSVCYVVVFMIIGDIKDDDS